MPSAKTATTELAVGFGILGINNPLTDGLNIATLFDGSLSHGIYHNIFLPEYGSKPGAYDRFVECGLILRELQFGDVNVVRWSGAEQQAATVLVATDIYVPSANTPVSIKFNSNVVANPSPHNLFRSLPSGMVVASQAADWYIEKNYPGIQALYGYVRERYPHPLPADIRDFYAQTSRQERRPFQRFLSGLQRTSLERFTELYLEMCWKVSRVSADEFNKNLAAVPGNMRLAVMESIVKQFLRINSVPYVLTGVDHNRDFGVRIPDLTSWRRAWSVTAIRAEPCPGRGQSVVDIGVEFENRRTQERTSLPYHVEVRWSHGKFCGNPEGKLYKDFSWRDVPFFEPIF